VQATGGTASAALALMNQCGAHVVEFSVQMELVELKGRAKLGENVPFHSFLQL
jgi:adenine/guanine phosphoribosyltransferase-like PRPP-binding protein